MVVTIAEIAGAVKSTTRIEFTTLALSHGFTRLSKAFEYTSVIFDFVVQSFSSP